MILFSLSYYFKFQSFTIFLLSIFRSVINGFILMNFSSSMLSIVGKNLTKSKTVKFSKVKVPRKFYVPLSHNVPAAWRQAGVSQTLGREQTMMLPAHFQTSQRPRLRQTASYVLPFLLLISSFSTFHCLTFSLSI